jgi:hypothetical protein
MAIIHASTGYISLSESAIERYAESLWHRFQKVDTREGWSMAEDMAHGAWMLGVSMGETHATAAECFDVVGQLVLAYGVEIKLLADIADQCAARMEFTETEPTAHRPQHQAGNVSAVMLSVVACLALIFGVATPVARDSLTVRVISCPAPTETAPTAQPAVANDWI